jgi:Txe/YoeB family toxin of Txe-Axe toxin-antitoxin module
MPDVNEAMDTFTNNLFDSYEISPNMFIDNHKRNIKKKATNILSKLKQYKFKIYPTYEYDMKNLSKLAEKDITNDDLELYSTIDTKIKVENCSTIYEYFIKHILGSNPDRVRELIHNYKQHFVDEFTPEYLPGDFFSNFKSELLT